MKLKHLLTFTLLGAAGSASLHAGVMVADKKVVTPPEEKRIFFPEDPAGLITLGVLWSENRTGAYLDSITGLYAPKERDAFLFLNSRYHFEDSGQFIDSTGIGFRKLFKDQKVILGVNAYYDALHSESGNDYAQFGVGAEALTQWVDARINYYLPQDKEFEVGGFTRRDSSVGFVPGGIVTNSRSRVFRKFEQPVEGLNLEVGFLIPGLEKFTEVRVFGGFHHYVNPFGGDFDGFQARLEVRLLPGVIADLEYWDDARLMGGHWTAGLRASVPFSIYNLATGRNPFEGASDMYKVRSRDFSERMSEMVIRSHRIQTVTSNPKLVHEDQSEKVTPVVGGPFPPPNLGIPFE